MADFQTKLNLLILLHLNGVNVIDIKINSVGLDIVLDFLAELLVHSILVLFKTHVGLSELFFDVQVVGNSPLVNISFKRRLDRVFNSANERLVHDVLVAKVWHLVTRGSVNVATKLSLFLLLGCLSSFDPLEILLELALTLLSLPIVFFSFWALQLMIDLVLDCVEHMVDIVCAVALKWCSVLSDLRVCVVKSSLELAFVLALCLMLDES